MESLTPAHLDEINRMLAGMVRNRREHPELYCDHWELGYDLFNLFRQQSPEPSPRPGLLLDGIRLEVNPYLPENLIVCVDVVKGERKIVKIIKVSNATQETVEAKRDEAGRENPAEAEER